MSTSIMIDGHFVHVSGLDDKTLVQSPHLRTELNRPDVLTFTMPPNNARFGKVKKRKDIVYAYIDYKECFYGQVIDERPTIDNMREYSCEGALSFLSDSIQRPLAITGKENLTAKAHFISLIESHNAQVEPWKRFTVGIVDASEKVMQKEDTDYSTTLNAVEQRLVNRYGGFLRVRRENDVTYIDWLKELTDVSTQSVEFGKNIVDLDGLIDTREIGSVLIPLGARVNGKKLTIADVNGGSDSIESAELIQKYGRVVITKEFPTIKDANELLEKAREALSEMEDDETFDITAVDLSRLGVDVSALRVGLLTPIVAPRHGIEKSKILYAADMDLENIENSVYTFGVPRQTLTEALAETARGGGGVGKKIDELSDIITDAYINIDQMKGDIELRAYQDEMNVRFSEAWIGINGVSARLDLKADVETVDEISRTVDQAYVLLDGANAAIQLKADKTYVEDIEKTVNQARIDIDGANALISLKADTETVNTLGERVSAAEIAIDGANSEIRLKANKTYVDDLFAKSITAETLSASLSNLDAIVNGSIQGDLGDFETVQAQGVTVGAPGGLSIGGLNYSAHSHEISVSDDGTVTFGKVTGTAQNFNIADTKKYKDGVSAAYEAGRQAGLAEADTSAAYAEGWMAARKEVRYSISTSNKTVTIYGPGSTVDGVAKFWTFDLALGFTSHMANQSTGKATAEIYANMRMDGSTVFTKTDTSTINIGGGLM
jgi:phage minor structural protein